MSLKDRGVPTVGEVIAVLKFYPKDAYVLVYEELKEIERQHGCNSGIRVIDLTSNEDNPTNIGFILTGH